MIKGKQFIDNCFNEHNIINYHKLNNKPFISVIIPVYNCKNTISAAIKSVQNQNFTDFEIILIDDFSSDNTSYIIKSIKERDSRIKIFKNKKNMGSLYSRSIGALSCKGDYILLALREFQLSIIMKILIK